MNKKASVTLLIITLLGTGLFFSSTRDASALVPAIHTRVSVNNTGNGQGGNGFTPGGTGGLHEISANGRFVVFGSFASNLVAGDTNGKQDIFVRDIEAATTTRVSVSASGVQANDSSGLAHDHGVAISQTGRYIAFTSAATNLIDGSVISGGHPQIYLRDTKTNSVKLVTRKIDGTIGNGHAIVQAVSNDGRFVLWTGDKNTNLVNQGSSVAGAKHVYLADLAGGSFTLLAPTDGATIGTNEHTGGMSCDGSFIIMTTEDQLTPDDTDLASDVYLIDLRNGFDIRNITLASSMSADRASISCNGNYIGFRSADHVFDSAISSSNTVLHQYLYDRLDNSYSVIDINGTTPSNRDVRGQAGIDDRGNVAFGALMNISGTDRVQTFLKQKGNMNLELLSQNSYGGPSMPGTNGKASISSDGKKAVYSVSNNANSLFSPHYSSISTYDSNGYGDIVMSLTGL